MPAAHRQPEPSRSLLKAPQRFLAAQLARPTGRLGRWVITRALNRRNAAMINATLEALALEPNDAFLDVGFGGGRSIELAAEHTQGPLWGIDYSGDMVVFAAQKLAPLIQAGRLNLLCGDATTLPLTAAMVSKVCSTNTLYFWPNPVETL
ncbi:MAG: class I SAM-dependent methyltransferase, partial [Polyangiales bacterium]